MNFYPLTAIPLGIFLSYIGAEAYLIYICCGGVAFVGFFLSTLNSILGRQRLIAALGHKGITFQKIEHFFFLNLKCNIEYTVSGVQGGETKIYFVSLGDNFIGLLSKKFFIEEFSKK